MPVSFEKIRKDFIYTRPQLAKLWGFKGYEAISRGVVTPSGTHFIILFITKEKQPFLTQYEDIFLDGILEIEGETSHSADNRIIHAMQQEDEIHLFYRKQHHMPFKYEGIIYLTDYQLFVERPSRFRFAVDQKIASADGSIITEEETHGLIDNHFTPDEEGRKRLLQHIAYERSRKNRAKAIEFHGCVCLACGFDFNEIYGADFARDFIEVHHVKSITEQNGAFVDPKNDLIPLCSNCHSMAHRESGRILTLDELRAIINKAMMQ